MNPDWPDDLDTTEAARARRQTGPDAEICRRNAEACLDEWGRWSLQAVAHSRAGQDAKAAVDRENAQTLAESFEMWRKLAEDRV